MSYPVDIIVDHCRPSCANNTGLNSGDIIIWTAWEKWIVTSRSTTSFLAIRSHQLRNPSDTSVKIISQDSILPSNKRLIAMKNILLAMKLGPPAHWSAGNQKSGERLIFSIISRTSNHPKESLDCHAHQMSQNLLIMADWYWQYLRKDQYEDFRVITIQGQSDFIPQSRYPTSAFFDYDRKMGYPITNQVQIVERYLYHASKPYSWLASSKPALLSKYHAIWKYWIGTVNHGRHAV